jgi:DNA-binding beta-propeller fold protein YncE
MHAPKVLSDARPQRLTRSLFQVLLWLCACLPALAHAQRMPQDSWYLAKEFRGEIEPGAMLHPSRTALGPDGNLYLIDRSANRVQVFDSEGTELRRWSWQFNDPFDIYVTQTNIVYVCEFSGGRVHAFDLQGNFLRTFEGSMSGPHGITVDDDGNVYVCEFYSRRVSVFNSEGKFLRNWGSEGAEDGKFSGLASMCLTKDRKIATLDRDLDRVQIFDSKGTFLSKFSLEGGGDGQSSWPYGLSTDASGNFYVVFVRNPCVSVYSPTGKFLRKFGSEGAGQGQFSVSFGTAVKDGKIFVPDYHNSRIAVFNTDGTWIKNFGSFGNPDFDQPSGIAVDASGNVFISDAAQNQIRKLDKSYKFQKRFGTSGQGDGQFAQPRGLAISPDGRLYSVDSGGCRVQIFDLEGNFLGKFGSAGSSDGAFNQPHSVAVAPDGRVYVSDSQNHRVQVFDSTGKFLFKFGSNGNFYGQFNNPSGIAISPNGLVAVADTDNFRIQLFDSDGKFVRLIDWNQTGGRISRVLFTTDGNLFAPGDLSRFWDAHYSGDPKAQQLRQVFRYIADPPFFRDSMFQDNSAIRVFSPSGDLLKGWPAPPCSLGELPSGDLIAAHEDRVVRVWKRTYRVAIPEPGNALPLPSVISQARRPGTSLVDVEYSVKDADNVTVQTAALAFKNGGNSLSDVIPITSFAEGSGAKLGANIPTGQTHRFTWDVTKDWSTDFGEVQLEILAKDGRGLFNLDFLQIPATQGNAVLKISRSPLTDEDFLSVWYWLVATGDPGIQFGNGVINPAAVESTFAYDGNNGVPGLTGVYFGNTNFEGQSVTRVDQSVNIRPALSSQSLDGPFQSEQLSVRWSGVLLPSETGRHRLFFTSDDGIRVWVNEQLVINSWWPRGSTEDTAEVDLTANNPVPIRIEYYDQGGGRAAQLSWQPPGKQKEIIPLTNLFTGVKAPAGSLSYTRPGQEYASGTTTTAAGRAYLFQKMGLREATPAEVTRAKEAGTPGVINKWAPKLQVGPGERPAAINSYGFDTGAEGYWVVPITN